LAHTAIIQGQEFRWVATLPDEIHLVQGGMSDADPNAVFLLNGTGTPNTPPLILDVHYTPEVLFGAAHGILDIHVAEPADQDFYGTPAHYADTFNGLRGTINILFHNDLGVPLHAPPGGLANGSGTLALFLTGVADQTAPTTTFHTPYTHFHAAAGTTLAQDFPGFAVHGQVGPVVGGSGLGNPTDAPDWILLSGNIPAGGAVFWGPLTLHNRDLSPAPDDFDLALTLLDGALTSDELAHVQALYTAAHPISDAALI
jgi:hypothetical protein